MIDFIIQKAGGGTINLYNKNASALSTVTSAEQSQGLNADDTIRITVESAVKIAFEIGDKINILGRWYKINRLPTVKKTGNRLFTYNIELEGVQYDLARVVYDLTIDTTSNALQDVQADMLTGNLQRFATVLIANANRVFPGKWVLGDFPAGTEDKTLVFGETDNCLLVLQRLCSEYNTEFEIIQAGDVNTLHFRKAGQIYPYTFEYGKGKGLYSLERLNVSTSNIVTRLKVYGGTRNITAKYRAARLCLPGKTKGQSYIQKTGPANNYGIWEATKIFEHIYPKRTGTVTAIDSGNVLKLTDSTMNFDLNEKEADGITTKYLIDGSPAKIHFNTGNLSGYEFEIQSYDHATKTFTLKPFEDERGERFPSEKSSAFKFAVNDKYVLLDIALPQSYIDDAEEQLAEEGDIYYDQNSQPKVQYSLEVAEEFLKELSGAGSITNIFSVGDYIPVKDADIDVDKSVRVQSFTRDLLNPFSYKLNISDTVTTSITNRVISELIEIDKITKINDIKSQVKARRDWRSAQELLDMVFDTEGDYYSEKIKPNSIETSMLAVGAKSTQFGLVGTVIQANYNGNKNSVNVKGGTLSHYAIEESGRNWTLADGTTTLTGDSTPYYIYAKCQKVGTAGSIIFSTSKITVDEDPSFYHFLIGVVNSVDTALNARSVALTYGFTTVNGRFVRTGRIQSNDGKTYFDLDLGEIGGKITFRSTGGTDEDLAEILDGVGSDIQDAQAAANVAALKAQQAIDDAEANVGLINTEIGKLQAQLDGEVSNWFYPYSPTLANYPASDWTTNEIKDRHIGDTFTNTAQAPATDAGKSWRFVKNGSVYSWTLIADSDAVKALLKAAEAQATADGKSTTFLIQPTSYKLGDMWVLNSDQTVNGTAYKQGEILTATQDSTTFNEAHWLKRVRYTDDTAVNNLQIGGRNLLLNTNRKIENSSYPTATFSLGAYKPIQGETVTIAFKGTLGAGKTHFGIFNSNATAHMADIIPSDKGADGVFRKTFQWNIGGSPNTSVLIFPVPNSSEVSSVEDVMLVVGNKIAYYSEAPEDTQAKIATAKQEALTAASNAQGTADSLKNFTDTAFRDGIIDRSESVAIEKYKNSLNEAMAKAEASYNKVYTNTYLEGAAQTSLLNAKINLWGQRDTLLSAINTAIAGGTTTPAQKTAVDNAFSSFNNLMTAFQNALEEANKAIQAKLEWFTANSQVGGSNLSGSISQYTLGTGWTRNGDTLSNLTTSTFNHCSSPNFNLIAGKTYVLSFEVDEIVGVGRVQVITNSTNTTLRILTVEQGKHALLITPTVSEVSHIRVYGYTSTRYIISNIKLNEAITDRVEKVKLTADEAQAKAQALEYLKQAIGQDAVIDGALYTLVTLLLKENMNAQVTAGFTGIQGALKNLPAIWAGGTYQQALTNLAKAIIRHDGTVKFTDAEITGVINAIRGKIGPLDITETGDVVMFSDEESQDKLIFRKSKLPSIASLVSAVNSNGSTGVGAGIATLSTSQVVSGSTNISNDGAIATFSGTTLTLSARGRNQTNGVASYAEAVLYARQNGVRRYKLATVRTWFTGESYTDESASITPLTYSLPVDAGLYTFELVIETSGTVSNANATSTSSTFSWVHAVAGVKRQQYGLDGMMFFFSGGHFYFNETGFLDGKAPADKWNAPGVLLSATVNENGGWNRVWGAKQSLTQPPLPSPTGRYTIYHTIGHTNYQVNCVSYTENRSFRVYQKNTNSVIVECRTIGSTPTLVNAMFDITLTGNNY